VKVCTKCGETKPKDQFKKIRQGKYLDSWCKPCNAATSLARYHQKNSAEPGYRKESTARRKILQHGISIDEYNALVAQQDGRCACCGKEPKSGKRLVIDHDHTCCPGATSCGQCIRGLLCGNCNLGIGLLGDCIDGVESAARYLRKKNDLQ